MTRMYVANFDNITVSAAQDFFEVAPAATVSVVFHGLMIGQSTDYGDAQAEGLRLLIIRGATTTGSGGATITPAPVLPGGAAASSTVKRNNTTAATGGTPINLHSDGFNVQSGYQIWWTPETRLVCAPSSRIVVNMPSTPADAINFNASLYFEEIG
jgi:hypothetical protein